MRTIATPTLTLEPQVAAHAEELFVVLGDPAIYEYEGAPPASVALLRMRLSRLEARQSPDGQEQWLNWVIRLPTSELAGFVQATVRADGSVAIAYVLASRYWGRGLARQAVEAMLGELSEHYRMNWFTAVFKRENARSKRLLERLGFQPVTSQPADRFKLEPGEAMMELRAGPR